MKMIKVNYIFVKENKVVSYRYFETEQAAKESSAKYNEVRQNYKAELSGEVEVIAHHTAIAKGYEPVKSERTECYSGKFGTGYIKHYPTKGSDVRSSWFHRIEYFIEK